MLSREQKPLSKFFSGAGSAGGDLGRRVEVAPLVLDLAHGLGVVRLVVLPVHAAQQRILVVVLVLLGQAELLRFDLLHRRDYVLRQTPFHHLQELPLLQVRFILGAAFGKIYQILMLVCILAPLTVSFDQEVVNSRLLVVVRQVMRHLAVFSQPPLSQLPLIFLFPQALFLLVTLARILFR